MNEIVRQTAPAHPSQARHDQMVIRSAAPPRASFLQRASRLSQMLLALLICVLALQPSAPAQQVPTSNHIFWTILENTNYSQVIGNPAMPYLNSLASQYGLATQFYANTHPSIGNYFMLTTGDIISNNDRFSKTITQDNIVRQLLAGGKTWKSYAEDLPYVGYIGGNVDPYYEYHNPFTYFSDVRNDAAQQQNLVPLTFFAPDLQNNTLPNYSYLLPNAVSDAHDCPDGTSDGCPFDEKLATADAWLQTHIAPIIASPVFQQDGLLIITFDESLDDYSFGGGRIVTVIISPHAKRGYQSTTFYQHESLLRLMCDALQISCPGAGATAPTMGEFFTTEDLPPTIVSAQATSDATVSVVFSEVMDPASASNPANYALNNGATVNGASLGADNRTVTLSTSTLLAGVTYTLTVNNVLDVGGNPIAPFSSVQFTTPTGGGGGEGGGSSGEYRTTILGDSPVGYWRLGETSGTVAADETGNNPGAYHGGYTLGQFGALPSDSDKAVLLNGSNGYIDSATGGVLALADGPLSLEAWVKRMSSNRADVIIHKGTNAYHMRIDSDNYLKLMKANIATIATSTVRITDNNWHHCVATKNGSSSHLYLDGVEVTGTVTNQTLANATSSSLRLGTDANTYINGVLDEVAIYNYVLTPERVSAHYEAAQLPAAPTGLTATPVSGTLVDLAWTNNATNASGTYIERSSDGVNFIQVTSVGAGATSYSDNAPLGGVTYYYRVRAFNGAGSSGYSNIASATTEATTPAATPTFSPAPGSYGTPQSVTLSDTTPGATIYYTTDGSTPTLGSTVYTAPIAVNVTTTIQAIAAAPGYSQSAVASGTYTLPQQAAMPTFSPIPATYSTAQSVTLSDTTPGATIYYTTDGSTPTTGSAVYSSPIAVSVTTTIKAIATASGYTQSAVASGTYTIASPAATPTFSPAPGTYSTTQSVTLSDTTPGATIYYTTNGATPTTGSTVYAGPIAVSVTTTIKAIATAPGFSQSAVASGTYTITPPPAPSNLVATASATLTSVIDLTWTNNSSNATANAIERSTDGVTFAAIATVSPTATNYADTGLASGILYYYRARAQYSAGYSAYSNIASATTGSVPNAPSKLIATAISQTQIDLAWTNSATNATGIRILERGDKNTYSVIATVSASATTYSVAGLTANTRYQFRVEAFNAYGESGYTPPASATTLN